MELQEIITAVVVTSVVFLIIFTISSIPRLLFNRKVNAEYIDALEKSLQLKSVETHYLVAKKSPYPIEFIINKPLYIEFRSTRFLLCVDYMFLDTYEKQKTLMESLQKKYPKFQCIANGLRKEFKFTQSPPDIAFLKAELEKMLQIMQNEKLQPISQKQTEEYEVNWDAYWKKNA